MERCEPGPGQPNTTAARDCVTAAYGRLLGFNVSCSLFQVPFHISSLECSDPCPSRLIVAGVCSAGGGGEYDGAWALRRDGPGVLVLQRLEGVQCRSRPGAPIRAGGL